jgi:O-antigen ligase
MAFIRGTTYFFIPLAIAAWLMLLANRKWFQVIEWKRMLPCLFLLLLLVLHLVASANHEFQLNRLRMLSEALSSIFGLSNYWWNPICAYNGLLPLLIIAIPLCNRIGLERIRNGMILMGFIFLLTLICSGQFGSILHGEGLIDVMGLQQENISGRVEYMADTITSASTMCLCVLACIAFIIDGQQRQWPRILVMAVGIGLFVCALLTGSKGPLVALFAAVLAILYIEERRKLIVVIPILAGCFYLGAHLLQYYEQASQHLFEDESRLDFYLFIIKSTPTLFGYGIGSFSQHFGGIDMVPYPHNSLLEMYYEMGIFGALLYLFVVGSIGLGLWRTARAIRDPISLFALAFFLYGLTFSMFSGSIYGDKELWLGLIFGCAILLPTALKKSGLPGNERKRV